MRKSSQNNYLDTKSSMSLIEPVEPFRFRFVERVSVETRATRPQGLRHHRPLSPMYIGQRVDVLGDVKLNRKKYSGQTNIKLPNLNTRNRSQSDKFEEQISDLKGLNAI